MLIDLTPEQDELRDTLRELLLRPAVARRARRAAHRAARHRLPRGGRRDGPRRVARGGLAHRLRRARVRPGRAADLRERGGAAPTSRCPPSPCRPSARCCRSTARPGSGTSSCRGSWRARSTSPSATPSPTPARTWPRCAPARSWTATEYVVNGQKIFTTGAHEADYVWLACRTDPGAPRHKGITILIAATADPGFSWTPIITHDGAHHVNATYYDHVRVPVRMRVGAENGGWRLITSQLNHERVMLGPAGRIAAMTDRVREWAAKRSLLARPDVRRALARASAVTRVNELLNWQVAAAPRAEHRRRVRDQGVLVRAGAADRAVARRGGRPARRPGRPGHRGPDDLAGRPAQAEHRADLRRRRERGPARAHRDRRPWPAAGAAMTGATAGDDPGGHQGRRRTGSPPASGDSRPAARPRPGQPADDPQLAGGARLPGGLAVTVPGVPGHRAAGDDPGLDDAGTARARARRRPARRR